MKSYALCIGNDNYEILTKLQCSVADAQSVACILKRLRFDVEIKTNLNHNELDNAVFGLENKVKEYDVVLFYYAGHGFQVDNENLLIPVDFNDKEDPITAKRRAFPIGDLMRSLDGSSNKPLIIILDACREVLGIRGSSCGFTTMYAPQGAIIAYSTSPGQTSKENSEHGLYTSCLLNHLDDPRISIETMFKRVREELAARTYGQQISWEHTSLIGDFQLNPNTIYDGFNYSEEAIADVNYIFDRYSPVKTIVEDLKKYIWAFQNEAIQKVNKLDFLSLDADDLFVLGRNIYQSACGNSYNSQRFINSFFDNIAIPIEAKLHILNGMVFEIYYDHQGKLRNKFKNLFFEEVIKVVESEPFYPSCNFIISRLSNETKDLFYIPGQNHKTTIVVFVLKKNDEIILRDITFNGESIYRLLFDRDRTIETDFGNNERRLFFEAQIRKKLTIMSGYLRILYEGMESKDIETIKIPADYYVIE